MITYEDMTRLFLEAAGNLNLVTHPEYWMNTRSLEREFACACHTGECEDMELQSGCTVSFSWGSLDTALSLDGPGGICEFFHDDSVQNCAHRHTNAIPPLVLDLSYTLSLHGEKPSDETLLSLTQMLKLQASERSRRTIETRPGVSMVLHENRLQPDLLTLQQRVEVPLWHPLGIHGLHDEPVIPEPAGSSDDDEPSTPHPEEWIPQLMTEICQDVVQVLAALNAAVSFHASDL
ncbi:hypothetical protein [Tengunoibacter tsumagoiensis]|uniref:Uncharacterized protein n=1 Tax=Tengunoibacter tsumagoiensis TaxID=2014871 RepID=A0A402A4W9_9CHLR|nr:hypothetical protein [Tengunoibacter tsumagoiensis]GCE14150.1 hypothetical protein KTT_40090 [Tengunoibacter tsumagoiensis]